jgi:predicted site-specific integrase-resolvase
MEKLLAIVTPGVYARAKGVKPWAVWNWCRSGKIEHIRTPGGQYRIVIRDPADLEAVNAVKDAA